MSASQTIMDVLLYSTVLSVLLVAVVMSQFYRRERRTAYLVWTLAFVVGAVRFALPASLWTDDALNSPILHYAAALIGILLVWGAARFLRLPVSRLWLLVLLVPAAWIQLGLRLDWPFFLRALLPSVFGALGYLAMAACFLLNQPPWRWNGHRLFALGAILHAIHLLDYPFLRDTDLAPWGFALAQVFHYMMAVALLLIWVRQEEYRALTAHRTQERALRRVLRSRQRVVQLREWTETLVEQISDGVIICDRMGRISGFNRAAERIFGYQQAEVMDRPLEYLLPDLEPGPGLGSLTEANPVGGSALEEKARGRDGNHFMVEISVSSLSLGDNDDFVTIVRDISERKRHEERLNYLAGHDALTGLLNRRAFEHRLGSELSDSQSGWLVFLDLDDFKLINDSLGHRAGDAALVAMARRLESKAGAGAVVARHSGDEFVVFRPVEQDFDLEGWLEELVGLVRQPVAFNDIEVMLSVSMGIAHYPSQGRDVNDLLRNADLAMYHAKRAGKNKYSLYRPEMLTQLNRTADIATRLKKLNLDRELFVVFQPRMRLDERQLVGAEVLVRWRTPEGDMIPPDRFIPVAEETGQILRIGYWVMEESCRFLAQWTYHRDPLVLSINLSARQLFDEQLLDRIEAVRNRHGLSPAQIEFEITESSAMQDLDYAVRVLSRLRALGYGLSLDDFGTGFSSLSHLRSLPVDTVKIDRSFVRDIARDRHDRVLVASIIELASHLDMNVLAEGVEDPEQLELLDSLGCDEVQGYLVSRPLEPDDFVATVLEGWEGLRAAL